MTTATMFVQRCVLFLAIFLCYVYARGEKEDYSVIDCELYPFHHTCRGMMSKKRAMTGNTIHGLGCDGSKGDLDCIKSKGFGERRRIPYIQLPRSKLWITLLDDDMQKDSSYDPYPSNYDVRHKKRRNSEMDRQYDERRIPLMENFLSELEVSDSDY